jgi:predicted short-subunit dehydrogenase-like oxidoreductase (DUF2520 family)
MKIVLFGSGNVAWNLGKLFVQYGHEVVQIVSRNTSTASALAYELNTESANYMSIINKEADLYVIAVKDAAIPLLVEQLTGLNRLIVHTSGAVPIEVLQPCSNQYGSLYPIQSLVYGVKEIPSISFLIEGNTSIVEQVLTSFVQSLQSTVQTLKKDDKLKLHLAAVLVNNFTNHLYKLAYDWCIKNNLDFQLLLPLIKETAERITEANPALLQTGPAARNDKVTIEKHKAALKDDPKLLAFYNLFTESIMGNQ